MTEYKLADGTVLTSEDIARECEEYERGTWEGRLERIHVGPGGEIEGDRKGKEE